MPLSAEELNRLCNEVLSVIEIQEARLLNWGFVNGAITLDDLDARLPDLTRRLAADSPDLAALWAQAQADGLHSGALVQNLVDRCLIFPSRNRYRSRFAETVRALFLLRQRFSVADWSSGDRLVGDMKLLLQRRRFPKRDVAVAELLAELAALELSPLSVAAIQALLQEQGRDLALARFQVQSTVTVLRNLQTQRESALVIGAGTGAGKTKAFYIPALAAIAGRLTADAWVQAIAVYPRTELLKDQLRETYAEARKLDRTLKQAGRRPIRVGAYYGDVPADAADVLRGRRENWRRTRDRSGWICPSVACPTCGQQSLIWSEDDLKLEEEDNRRQRFGRYARLTCGHCHTEVDATTLSLTRRQMMADPPDILFTTTEMLNRRLSNLRERALFGIGVAQPPHLLLMDEIHLNEGIHGAQIAYLLRRWRHLRRRSGNPSLCVVGLSATLTQADQFFARLTGLPATAVTYIEPAERDLVKEGLEYNVVLKGDPVSGTTLLSTSVRTAMLICRVLDPLKPPGEPTVSGGAYGQRAFAFSDKLDVINRWYHIEREVENPTDPYSQYLLVDRSARDAKLRYDQGQNWYFVPLIHGESGILTSGLRLDLTSSQYGGVDNHANLVVASSTLEVGYNDPSVGAILQHKTPHSRASFIQRKGRAGRTRAMRPWTLLVTSAYGHDRWAFQHAEQLFDPLLPPLDLPLDNYYVRKIQATFALLDWLADQIAPVYPAANVWQLLSSGKLTRGEELDPQRQALAAILFNLLQDEGLQTNLKQHLVDALALNALALNDNGDYMADTLLWGEPRPLLLEVIPTALRQLENRWQRTVEGQDGTWQIKDWADNTADRPLPDYLPAALFSDLKSPDVLVGIPERQLEGEPFKLRGEEPLGVALALAEYVPGKVNKRFARKERIRESHWFAVPDEAHNTQVIDLAALAATYDPTPRRAELAGATFDVYCPRTMTLAIVPHYVRPTSSARFLWQSQFTPQALGAAAAGGLALDWQPAAPLRDVLPGITALTHANGSWVAVTRAAPEVRVSTRFEHGREQRLRAGFAAGGQPAALGFGVDVDALRFAFTPLDAERLRSHPAWPDCYQRLAGQFYHHLFATDPAIEPADLNSLEIDWLWQISLAMFVQTAVERQCSPGEAVAALRSSFVAAARRALATIFDLAPAATGHASETPFEETAVPSGGADDEQPGGVLAPETNSPAEMEEIGFLHARLLGLLSIPAIQQAILRHLPVLWQDNHQHLAGWLGSVYAHSLGAALFTTLGELAPEVQSDDLHYDIDEAAHAIWVSEAAAGGVGLVARLANQIAQHPRRFELHFRKTIRTCPRRTLAGQLNQVANLVLQGDRGVADAFAGLRNGADLPRIEATRLALAVALERHGIAATRALSVNLNMKFLRPNSDADTDLLVATLAAFWQAEEQRLGFAIDLRAIAVSAALHPAIQRQVRAVLHRIGSRKASASSEGITREGLARDGVNGDGANADGTNADGTNTDGTNTDGTNTDGTNTDGAQTYNLLQSMLWLDCHDACPDCIERMQRYQAGPRPSRALLALLLEQDVDVVYATAPGWQNAVTDKLAAGAHCAVLCPHNHLAGLASALAMLTATPIDVESQLLYPVIEGIERHNGDWRISLVISELAGE